MFQTFSDYQSEHFWCILSLKICIDRMPHPRSKSHLARRDHKGNKNVIKCNGILWHFTDTSFRPTTGKRMEVLAGTSSATRANWPGRSGRLRTKSIMTDLTLGATVFLEIRACFQKLGIAGFVKDPKLVSDRGRRKSKIKWSPWISQMHQCLFVIISVSLRRRDQEGYGKEGQWTTVQCSFSFHQGNKYCGPQYEEDLPVTCLRHSKRLWYRCFWCCKMRLVSPKSLISFVLFVLSGLILLVSTACWRYLMWHLLSCCHVSDIFRLSIGTFWCILSLKICIDRMPHPRSKSHLARRDHKGNKNVIKCNGIFTDTSFCHNWKRDGTGCRNLLSHKSQLVRQVARRIACNVLDWVCHLILSTKMYKVYYPKILPCCSLWQEIQFCHADSSVAGSLEEKEARRDEHIFHTLQALQFSLDRTPLPYRKSQLARQMRSDSVQQSIKTFAGFGS